MLNDISYILKNDKGATMVHNNQVVTKSNKSEVNAVERIKHPLQNSWSFWLFKNTEKKTWEENLVKLTTFDTVEDYWCLYHHMKRPSELNTGQEYAVFKNNARPTWDDDANKRGGRWIINFEKDQQTLDDMWLYIILLMIGENFGIYSDDISGVVISVRDRSKIGIWLSNSKNKKAILEIGYKVKDTLGLRQKLNFHEHRMNKNLYII